MTAPVLQQERVPFWKSRYGWTIVAFILAGIFISGLLIWQLLETNPRVWCQIAETANDTRVTGCYGILLKLTDIKDHTIIGLLAILGTTVLSIVAVALGVKISASGPGATSVNIGRENTNISNGDIDVDIPTPPSGDK